MPNSSKFSSLIYDSKSLSKQSEADDIILWSNLSSGFCFGAYNIFPMSFMLKYSITASSLYV